MKAVIVQPSKKKETQYPKLVSHGEEVALAITSHENRPYLFTGVIISSDSKDRVGHFSSAFSKSMWNDFEGTISLENDRE